MFKERSHKKELLDEENIDLGELHRNLRELEVVNKWLGGTRISTKAFESSIKEDNKVLLADIGCGGGDILKEMAQLAQGRRLRATFLGIDNKTDCINFAQKNCEMYPEIKFICSDYRDVLSNAEVTHIHAALFCHHLSETQIIELVRLCTENGKVLIINDLERHPVAYYSIWLLTRLLRGSRLVKNDAPLSVLRGFKTREWHHMLKKAGATNFSIKWKWAFRHVIVVGNGAL